MRTSRNLLFTVASLLLAMAAAAAWVAAQSDVGNQNENGADHRQFFPIILRNMSPLDEEMERDALVALYQSTNGAGWQNSAGWLGTETHCKWFGVSCANMHVTNLDLPYNHLVGGIARELGNLSSLQVLDLSGNQLSGAIPKELGNLSSLERLLLFSNQLSGPIPKELSNLSGLDWYYGMILYNNHLSCWETGDLLEWALAFSCGKYPGDTCFDYPAPGKTICP